MCQVSKHIHVKLRKKGEKAELFIRSLGEQWDPTASISEDVKNTGEGLSVSYSYVYKMNIVCITCDGKAA